MDNKQPKKRATEQKDLWEVIRCLHYLDRQGIVPEAQDGSDNFTQLLRLLSTNNKNILHHLEGKIGTNIGIMMSKIRFCILWLF